MRNVLFRGKQKDNGDWIEGFFVNAKWYLDEKQMSVIIPIDETIFPYCEIGYEQVIPETVGQFTGLVDCKGKKIFESDIVKIQIGDITKCGIVAYSERAARVGIIECGNIANFSFMQQPLIKLYSITIVGNIHDNPDFFERGTTNETPILQSLL